VRREDVGLLGKDLQCRAASISVTVSAPRCGVSALSRRSYSVSPAYTSADVVATMSIVWSGFTLNTTGDSPITGEVALVATTFRSFFGSPLTDALDPG